MVSIEYCYDVNCKAVCVVGGRDETEPLTYGPIHMPHAVTDLNQSEMWNVAIFRPMLVSQTTAWHTLTQCGFVVFDSITITQQNGCNGAYRVIDLNNFQFRSQRIKLWHHWQQLGLCFPPSFCFLSSSSIFDTLLSFFLCIALSDSWCFSLFSLGWPLPSQ